MFEQTASSINRRRGAAKSLRPEKPSSLWLIVLFVCAALLLGAPNLRAQNVNATVLGTVSDSSQAAIPRATVTAVQVATNYTRTVVTDSEGNYELPLLPVGEYRITAEAGGFRKLIKTGIVLRLEAKVRVDFALQAGDISETVSVTATPPLVDAYTVERNLVIDSKKIVELPLRGRNFTDLLKLTPSVVDRSYSGGAYQFPPYTFNGIRPYNNRFLLDGSNNSDFLDGRTVINPSVDAIQEFSVKTNQYSAEYGGGGGIVNATIKSGTNQYHGSVYEFLRNEKLNARPFFQTTRPPTRFNQFGFVFSGPVRLPEPVFGPLGYDGRDRTFFLVNYEGIRERNPGQRFLRVPTAAERRGDFSALTFQLYDPVTPNAQATRTPFAGNIIPRNRWNPFVEKVLAFYPEPNMPLNTLNQNYVVSRPNSSDTDQFTVRMDQRLSEKWNVFGRYSKSDNQNISPENFAGSGGNLTGIDARNVVVGVTTAISPRTFSEFRFGYTWRKQTNNGVVDSSRNYDADFGFPYAGSLAPEEFRFPVIGIVNLTGLGGASSTQFQGPNRSFYFSEALTFVRGQHSLKTGFTAERFKQRTETVFGRSFGFNGNFTSLVSGGRFTTPGNALADFLLGYPFQIIFAPTLPGIGKAPNLLTASSYAGYIQDDWKVAPRMTVNLGLRYELNMPPVEDNNRTVIGAITPDGIVKYPRDLKIDDKFLPPQFSSPVVVDGKTVAAGQYFRRVDTRQIWRTDKNNFQPRIGLSFRPFNTDNTVVRAGYSIFNGRQIGLGAFAVGVGAPFLNQTEARQDQTIAPAGLRLGELPPGSFSPEGVRAFSGVPEENPDSFIQNWTLSIQQQLGRDMKIEVAYLGNRADNININRFFNIRQVPGLREGTGCPAPCPVARPFARLFPWMGEDRTRGPFGWSNFHGLEINVERRFSAGLTFTSTFNWNRGMDNGVENLSDVTQGGQPDQQPENPFNERAEKGRSHDTAGLRYNASFVYELPVGKGRRLLAGAPGVVDAILGGWQISGIVTLQSGLWFHPHIGSVDNSGTGVTRTRPNRLADGNLPNNQRTLTRWFDTAAFVLPPLNTFGNSGRRVLEGPGVALVDFGLFKSFRIRENHNLQFRSEFFNAFNHANFLIPAFDMRSVNFGRITGTSTPPRNIQLSLKYVF